MNITFIKELQDSITESSNEFITEQNRLDNAKSAARLSLYYAHGNTEKNEINYRTAKTDQLQALSLNTKAVKGVNLATNAVTAAKQSLVDSGKATSNVSTAAASMQIAANAITKLSSDVASILAVANAADYGSKIQDSVEKSYKKIKHAAKLAEEVSLISLQATIEAAQSTASTVVTEAEATLASVTNFQKSTASQYSAFSEQVVSANEGYTAAKKVEKAASATFDIARQQDNAIKSTRKLINKVSNNNLILIDPVLDEKSTKKLSISAPKTKPGESYLIQFDKVDNEDQVSSYRIIMVKYDEAEAFDISIAKDLEVGTYCQVLPKGFDKYSRTFYLLGTDQALIPILPKKSGASASTGTNVHHEDIRGIAVDYNGKPIERGVYYVAFVYAVFTDAFQKMINNTDGYLSLQSKELILQKFLNKAPEPTIFEPYFDSRNFEVMFEVPQKEYDPDLLEYRIITVDSENITASKINQEIKEAIEKLDDLEFIYNVEDQKLEELESALNQLEIQFNTTQIRMTEADEQLEAVKEEIDKAGDHVPPSLKAEKEALEDLVKQLKEKMTENMSSQSQIQERIFGSDGKTGQQEVVQNAKKEYKQALAKETAKSKEKKSDFIFDISLMDTVTPANYVVATPFKWTQESAKILNNEAKERLTYAETRFVDALILDLEANEKLTKAKDALDAAQEDVTKAILDLSKKEAALDNAEFNSLKSRSSDEESEEGSSKNSRLQKAIDAVRKAQENLTNAQAGLFAAEVALATAREEISDLKTNILGLVSDYIKAKYDSERAARILQIAIEKKGEDAEDHYGTTLFYTELGEDATDNYGEPLQFNQENLLKYAKDLITSEVFLDTQKRVESIKKQLSKENLQKKSKADKISYQFVVLSAIKSTDPDDVADYKEQHSPYSKAYALYGTVE